MADDTLRLGIEADASGVDRGVKQAKDSLGDLGDSVDRESKNLNRYGEKLGKAFGPGEGLHGRLTELETPLRDSEGAFARAQMAVIEFGNEGATAADKIGAGFLLAGDSIAAFASGGVVGIAIAAGVAGISMIATAMQSEAAAAEEAAKAEKEHAKALEDLGKAAVDAGISIAALQAKEAAQVALAKVRAVEQDRLNQQLRKRQIEDRIADLNSELRSANKASEIFRIERQLREEAAALASQNRMLAGFGNRLRFAQAEAKEAQAFYLNDLKLSGESAVTSFVEATKGTTQKAAEAMQAASTEAAKQSTAVSDKRKKDVFDNAAHERQVRKDNAAFNLQTAQQTAEAERQIRFEAFKKQAVIDLAAHEKRRQLALQEAAFAKKLAEERTHMAMAAANTVTGALFEQAKAGELNASKLLEAVLASTGQELVARGTLHAFEGVATANPVMAGTGAAMIASGLAMGAASGAVSRAGQPAATPSSTPTDTRQSRAASTAGSSEGGTTVINFNGDAYDRRGVSNVLNSGLKMARHRRVMGA
tara:strand:+ start:8641 stop:10248 length:1608 start_codon:yes stop_codon:yes gene_type:complete